MKSLMYNHVNRNMKQCSSPLFKMIMPIVWHISHIFPNFAQYTDKDTTINNYIKRIKIWKRIRYRQTRLGHEA